MNLREATEKALAILERRCGEQQRIHIAVYRDGPPRCFVSKTMFAKLFAGQHVPRYMESCTSYYDVRGELDGITFACQGYERVTFASTQQNILINEEGTA